LNFGDTKECHLENSQQHKLGISWKKTSIVVVVVVRYECFYPIPKVLQPTDLFFLGLGKKLKNFNLNESALTGVFFNFVIFKKIPNPFVGKTTKFVEK
jgi:hypothetical protein